jgi:hypothetical protein
VQSAQYGLKQKRDPSFVGMTEVLVILFSLMKKEPKKSRLDLFTKKSEISLRKFSNLRGHMHISSNQMIAALRTLKIFIQKN